MIIAGPTGSGKTTLASSLLNRRQYVIGLVSKSYDPTFARTFGNYKVVKEYRDIHRGDTRVLIWPAWNKPTAEVLATQRDVFSDAIEGALRDKGWCIYLDETPYITDSQFGRLSQPVAMLHHTGRSSGISMVTSTQRPANIPLIIYNSASHAYIARTTLTADHKRLGDLGGYNHRELINTISSLPSRHDYVYVPVFQDAEPVIVNTRS